MTNIQNSITTFLNGFKFKLLHLITGSAKTIIQMKMIMEKEMKEKEKSKLCIRISRFDIFCERTRSHLFSISLTLL
jgi:hypothetical protein